MPAEDRDLRPLDQKAMHCVVEAVEAVADVFEERCVYPRDVVDSSHLYQSAEVVVEVGAHGLLALDHPIGPPHLEDHSLPADMLEDARLEEVEPRSDSACH